MLGVRICMSPLFCYYNVTPDVYQLYEEKRLAILEIQGKTLSFLSFEETLTTDGVTIVVTCRGKMSSGNWKDP